MVAADIDTLASFYQEAIGCRLLAPIAEFANDALSKGIGAPGAKVRIGWLSFPGGSDGAPILELYQLLDWESGWAYAPGQGHLAFEVEDVGSTLEKVIASGGSRLGELVEWEAPSGNVARFIFARDPEGNVVDLWQRL